jgi:ABC-type amino acid transport substrate-binding protein
MDLVEVPHDLFQLYVPTTLLNGKFDSMVGAMSLFAFALVTATALAGDLRLDPRRLVRFATLSGLSLGAAVLAARLLLGWMVDTTDTRAEALRNMHASRHAEPPTLLARTPPRDAAAEHDVMERILTRGTLRVGYFPERVPFSFRNASGEIVGFDIEMAAQMAEDLGVRLELVTVRLDGVERLLADGRIDVVPSLPYTYGLVQQLRLSRPYMDATVGLLVRDLRRDEFQSLEQIHAHKSLSIGVVGTLGEHHVGENLAHELLGDTPHEIVILRSLDEVLAPSNADLDAVITLAEAGMAWSLLHPQFSVVIPKPTLLRRPLAFGLAPDAGRFGDFVDAWVTMQQARGNVSRGYDYWVLGKGTERREPRWSIARDVLGWIE